MEYAKKFILVPNDQISKHVPTEETLSELDREMSAMLKNKKISDDEKVKLYMQVLQKRLNILDHNNVVQETISEAPHTEEEEKQDLVEKSDLMEQLILESAPKNLKSNTRNILNYVKKSQDLMHWTPKGELIYKGKNVKHSNVLDLIKSLQTSSNKAHPPGFDMFLQGLSEMNFPKSFIKNSSLELDSEIKKEEISPKRRKHTNAKSSEWLSFPNTRRKK
ncbi:hypothetical protein AVEN_144341-1 [Araneus ventricosus]|uniref:Uncharacterized protein n=1 Tax=Araneus ventricosus TaxID=182803 RepID=A0A4Y2WJD4_ARAVE|nr:hypothetical protein AVEN_144341-1 [Araneus ventricosus]